MEDPGPGKSVVSWEGQELLDADWISAIPGLCPGAQTAARGEYGRAAARISVRCGGCWILEDTESTDAGRHSVQCI
jgi:hypothetical protein